MPVKKNHLYFGIGYMRNIKRSECNDGQFKRTFVIWNSMLQRCYDQDYQQRHPTYVGCTVAEEWHNFDNFEKWYSKQPNSSNKNFQVEKDFIKIGNKVYGPEFCFLADEKLNKLLINPSKNRKNDLPVGVTFDSNKSRYRARVNINGKKIQIGSYATVEEAFLAYKTKKEEHVKQVAELHKDSLPKKAYENLMNFTVEIGN